MPQSQTPANPRHQEEEKRDENIHAQNKQTNVREAQRPAPKRGDQNAKTNGRNEDKEHQKTLKHYAPRGINHKLHRIMNNNGTTALELSVA